MDVVEVGEYAATLAGCKRKGTASRPGFTRANRVKPIVLIARAEAPTFSG